MESKAQGRPVVLISEHLGKLQRQRDARCRRCHGRTSLRWIANVACSRLLLRCLAALLVMSCVVTIVVSAGIAVPMTFVFGLAIGPLRACRRQTGTCRKCDSGRLDARSPAHAGESVEHVVAPVVSIAQHRKWQRVAARSPCLPT
jgi:hypothetical protein